MSFEFTRRETLELLGIASLGRGSRGRGRATGHDHDSGPTLNRLATTVPGAEITGLYLTERGHLFFNVQHPDVDEDGVEEMGRVGAVVGANMGTLPQDFASLQPPKNDEQRRRVRTAVGRYQELARGGDATDDGRELGMVYDPDGEALTGGINPDFNGFVPAPDAVGDEAGYLFTNWEHRPGGVSRLHLVRNGRNGPWRVEGKTNVDFSDVEGTWVNCFGTVSPWGTPLTSEENYAAWNAAEWNNPHADFAGVERLAEYLGGERNEQGIYAETFPNPYRYGYIVELEDPAGEPEPVKQFAIGRATHENAVVMPDRKTVYTTSDGTGRVFFKFVADEAGDLTSGTLFAAQATQDRGRNPNKVGFDLAWIPLAHGSNDEIESWIGEYDDVTQADYDDGNSYITDEEIQSWARGDADDDRVAFLESGKAAAALGATAEFRKMEGVNVKRNAGAGDYLYVTMSAIEKTMTDGEGDIQLEGNEYGAVYRMRLDENYNVSRMEPAVTGGPNANVCGGCPYDARPDSASTVCRDCSFNPTHQEDPGIGLRRMAEMLSTGGDQNPENTIANPDNVVVMDDGRVIIGEDTGLHETNMIWVFDPRDDRARRA